MSKVARLYELKPEVLQLFLDFNGKVFADGALSTKAKEPIAVVAAHVTQCPYCIASRTKNAKSGGVRRRDSRGNICCYSTPSGWCFGA